ncbi:hypothetical protein DICPUDRAFT_149642 [Dictyostelium purpureum]|uniref:Uncharacterized protein n=1 Tax=Dictyostelium purpureum TaxID=5786 RepID=F0ZEA6_DICPU|nr:uncharacterized protein DICPUDRAFT_149642 [Dictyostelium purpureum]EGC37739.1 hypothetical protein DICPUDRAFT_149642 [Dictyostelium purpureum]|eukprot:XP_003285760.1 hypothetical protein DICPUDRAFT_149642 [Dictyostelium purpureum]
MHEYITTFFVYHREDGIFAKKVTRPSGVEPETYRFVAGRYIQLNYSPYYDGHVYVTPIRLSSMF